MKCSLVIPTYNEASVIGETIRALAYVFDIQLSSRGYDWQIIVADNASTDGTADVVDALGDKRVTSLCLKEKGKGRAVRAGFHEAKGEIVGFTDADLSVPPETIANAFINVCNNEAHVVIGSRAHPKSVMPGREWWRILSSQAFNFLVRLSTGVAFRDTQCPLKVMNRHAQTVLLCTQEETWFFDLEFLALAERLGYSIMEVPVVWNEHRYPERKSKLSTTRDGLRSLLATQRIRSRLNTQVAELQKKFTMGNMKWIIVGLGNPGGAYTHTRHNVGRLVLEAFRFVNTLPDWEFKKSYNALVSSGEVDGKNVILLEPETFMNESGKSLVSLVKSQEQSEQLIVIHDDIDLPIGTWRISFDRGSGGHNGIKSIMSVLKTNAFLRVRIGVGQKDEQGKLIKPKGEEAVVKFVLGKATEEERASYLRVANDVALGILSLLHDGRALAMNKWNER